VRYAALYREAKHRARGLDYSDQILFVRRLLKNSEATDWVRYKLDGGIKHILLRTPLPNNGKSSIFSLRLSFSLAPMMTR